MPVLNGVDLTVEPGQHVAIVGASGSGKSTLFALLLRLYAPSSGAIAIDGHDVRRFTAKSLRDQISVVPQDPVLFHATLWENIAYGRPGARRDEILRAARLANAHEFISRLPRGYDTVVGERGETLVRRPAPAHRHRARRHPAGADPPARRAVGGAGPRVRGARLRRAGAADGRSARR